MNTPMLARLHRFATPIGALAAWTAIGLLSWAGEGQKPRSAVPDSRVTTTGARQAEGAVARAPAKPVDREAWARKLAGLKKDDWRTAFEVGQALADLPPDEGFAILKANWEKIGQVEARRQILKAWHYRTASPAEPGGYPPRTVDYPSGTGRYYPPSVTSNYLLSLRNHPRLIDALDLGMRDPSNQVQHWAQSFLRSVAFEDFSEDFQAYKAWYQVNRGKPPAEVVVESVRRLVAETAKSEGKEAQRRARFLTDNGSLFRDMPEARKAALDAGLLKILERWIAAGTDRKAGKESIGLAAQGLSVLPHLNLNEQDLRRVIVPLLAKDVPSELRSSAMAALKRKEFPWAVDLLIESLKSSLEADGMEFRGAVWQAAMALGEIGDPKAIPTMIAVMDADNTYDTVYGIGWFGLHRITGVPYDDSHDGAWWRQWWEKNKERYPAAVREMKIPKLQKTGKSKGPAKADSEDPLADVADVPAQDLRAGGDAKKRYFLVGAGQGAAAPAEGYGLLIVLPGGDGSAGFHPFVRRIYKHVLSKEWLIAQPVAPKWDDKQFDQVVWPTAGLPYLAAKFTTEEFLLAVVADVRAKVEVNPKRVFLFGWSSGGPPCYATALRKGTPVTGAFIAMSVFKPGQLPALDNAKGKAFYLLQSPQDEVTPMQFAEAAEKALRMAGAKVRLKRYEGGHGWRGNVWEVIGDAVAWLDK